MPSGGRHEPVSKMVGSSGSETRGVSRVYMRPFTSSAVLSLALLVSAAPTTATAAERTGCAASDIRDLPELVVEEYPLVRCSDDSQTSVRFPEWLPDSIEKRRRRWRWDSPLSCNLDKIDSALARFGYRLRRRQSRLGSVPPCDLLKGDSVIMARLTDIGGFMVDQHSGRFLFTASGVDHMEPPYGSYWLFLDGNPQPWEPWAHDYWPPLLLDGSLVTFETEAEGGGHERVIVKQGSQVIYAGSTRWGVCCSPIDRLESDGVNWVLEYADTVVVNGVNLNRQLGHDAVFCYRILHGWPLYLFTRDNKVRMFYGSAELPYSYDDVKRGWGCEAELLSPDGNDHMVWFYARRDGWWYYVEAGVYK